MAKIYISSTYSDLIAHRQQVYNVLRKMRYDVIAMEDYVATDERPLDKCLADVASCDIYVGILAWRYGYVPPGQERSITELEYQQAGESGLERLIFLLDEDAPWPLGTWTRSPVKGKEGKRSSRCGRNSWLLTPCSSSRALRSWPGRWPHLFLDGRRHNWTPTWTLCGPGETRLTGSGARCATASTWSTSARWT